MFQNHMVKIGGALTISFGLAAELQAEPTNGPELGPFIGAGEASWYGEEVATGRDRHGNLIYNDTASGQAFDPNRISAAHRTLDLPACVVVVTENGERLRVNVNDRGPYADDRIIDLSRAAAERLNVKDQGEFNVRLYLCPA